MARNPAVGTSNCTIMISDERIASPMTNSPSAVIVMNEPSFAKFIPRLKPGGVAGLQPGPGDQRNGPR